MTRRERRIARVASHGDILGAKCCGKRPMRGPAPTRMECDGSRPWARANASGSPGSGGRHQQLGGPAGCGHSALSTEPRPSATRLATPATSASLVPSGLQSKTRCGAPRSPRSRACFQPGCFNAAAATKTPARPARDGGVRTNGRRSTARNPSSVAGGSSSRRARIWLVGPRRPGSRTASTRSSCGVGREPNRSSSRSTRLTWACASGVSSQMHRVGTRCRLAASITWLRAARVRYVLSRTTRRTPDDSSSSSASASSRRPPPRSSRLRRR